MTVALMTTKAIAAEFGLSEAAVRQWVRRGILPITVTVGRTNYFLRADALAAERMTRRRIPRAPA